MLIVVGLIMLIAGVVVAVAGVLANAGNTHTLNHGFSVFGYHVTGSTGTLFLYGIVVGALALLGLCLLLAGARRTSRRGRDARRGLKQSRREPDAVRQDRDDLIDLRQTALTPAAVGAKGSPHVELPVEQDAGRPATAAVDADL